MRPQRAVLAILALILFLAPSLAEAPVPAASPEKARGRIVDIALSYKGSPYLFGGTDEDGFDCSGLVYRVFLQCTGVSLPRTAKEQFDFREPIDKAELQPGDLIFFNTAGPITHVGIYEGDGRFIHAASEGPKLGVIESSLSDGYWDRAFAGAGRIVPPAGYLGLIFSASLGPSFGAEESLRGAQGSIGIAYRIFDIEAGIEIRPEYDATLGDLRVPAVLSLDLERRLKIFAGPALTFGAPNLGGARGYEASGGLLATAGVEYTFSRFRVAGMDAGIAGNLEYNRYVSDAPADLWKDAAAQITAGIGFSLRWGL
jgi:probable lipoprotein NlpC